MNILFERYVKFVQIWYVAWLDCYIIYLIENIVTYKIDLFYVHLPFLHHLLLLYVQYFMYNVSYNLKNTSLPLILLSIFQS